MNFIRLSFAEIVGKDRKLTELQIKSIKIVKKKIFGAALIAAMAVTASWNFNQSKNETQLSDLAMANVDALAQDESNQEKKYRYTDSMEECTVYVGGAYAKGKKIICWSGSDHPTCVDCKL